MFNKLLSDNFQRSWVAVGSAAITIGTGVVKGIQAKKAQKNALARRKPYQTAKELIEANNMQRSLATQGFTPETLDYFTNQNDRGFANSLDAVQRLGGDANSAAALFDQRIQNTFKIGAENSLLNMQNFSKMIEGERYLAQSRDAEWASQESMIKDEQAAAQQRRLEASATETII